MASIKKDNINPSLDRITDQLQTKVTRQAFLKFRATTPKRTGRKAPDGMSKPTSDFLDKLIRKIIRK
mgnify:CR=1 FL=1